MLGPGLTGCLTVSPSLTRIDDVMVTYVLEITLYAALGDAARLPPCRPRFFLLALLPVRCCSSLRLRGEGTRRVPFLQLRRRRLRTGSWRKASGAFGLTMHLRGKYGDSDVTPPKSHRSRVSRPPSWRRSSRIARPIIPETALGCSPVDLTNMYMWVWLNMMRMAGAP